MMQQRKQEEEFFKSLYAELRFKIDEILITKENAGIMLKKERNYHSGVF
jgi:hypothetical protein